MVTSDSMATLISVSSVSNNHNQNQNHRNSITPDLMKPGVTTSGYSETSLDAGATKPNGSKTAFDSENVMRNLDLLNRISLGLFSSDIASAY